MKMKEDENPQQWREERYWNEECDLLLKAKIDFINNLYSRFAGSKTNDKKGFSSIKRMNLL